MKARNLSDAHDELLWLPFARKNRRAQFCLAMKERARYAVREIHRPKVLEALSPVIRL
jgi:hypothetical protein